MRGEEERERREVGDGGSKKGRWAGRYRCIRPAVGRESET